MLNDYRLFFQQYLQHFHSTGAIAPSSRWLAAALARYVRRDSVGPGSVGPGSVGPGSVGPGSGPRRILEVGPGTGAVTGHIVSGLGGQDALDLVELNDRFVRRLRDRFASEGDFAAVAGRCRVIHQPIEELPRETSYDAIVSGLPLNNFAAEDVRRLLDVLMGLLAPGGTLSFFEYIGVRPARAIFSGGTERDRLRGVGAMLGETLRRNEFRRECILPNLPPAWVHHLRANGRSA